MKVLSVIAQKGGSGKTTLALSVAVAARREGKSVAVIDLDSQSSACKWGDRRPEKDESFVIVSVQPARLGSTLEIARANGADLVVIDTPPRAADAAMEAAAAADLIFIPCRATAKDLETLKTTRQLITSTGTKAPVAVVLNAAPPSGPLRREAEKHVQETEGMELAPLAFGQRVDFTYADIAGQTAEEYAPASPAAREIEQLYKFASKLLNLETSQQPGERNVRAPEFA